MCVLGGGAYYLSYSSFLSHSGKRPSTTEIFLTVDKCTLDMNSTFWNVHGIMNTSVIFKGFTLILQETRSIHDSMNRPKIEFIAYIYILL